MALTANSLSFSWSRYLALLLVTTLKMPSVTSVWLQVEPAVRVREADNAVQGEGSRGPGDWTEGAITALNSQQFICCGSQPVLSEFVVSQHISEL